MDTTADREAWSAILDQLQANYPAAGTKLQHRDLFELLVAVVLSAQTTDARVNAVTAKLFAVADTPETLARLPLAELEQIIRPVGLYRSKAKNLHRLAVMLMESYQGQVPESFDDLLRLPGVGRKTANVVTAVGLEQPGLGVDTHVARVTRRLGYAEQKDPVRIEFLLKNLIPVERWAIAHHLLIAHGRSVCKARKPNCGSCSIAGYCAASGGL
jgi:endonuclease-3